MKKRTHKRRKKSSTALSGRPRRRRSKGFLGDAMSGANLKSSAINAGLGLAGGAGATIGTKLTNALTKGNVIANMLVGAGIGFLASALGAPKMGIGYAGGAAALALSGGLKDDGNTEFAEDDVLEEGEIYQTESGEFVKMLNDGSMEYLSEEEAEALSEGEIYPAYSTMNAFQQ